jgi:3-oxoacyl-[acyl-carrier protein] reductase
VRINAVAPGWTATQKKIDEGLNQNHVDKVVSTMALKKLATPEDVANTIVILASDSLSGHTTGQVVEIAGGMEGRLITGTK